MHLRPVIIKQLFICCLFIYCLCILHTNAGAVLIERDWQTPGDALLTYDTDTGLEWLDVPATSDMSYNQVAALMTPGATYESFSFASEQQVLDFFHSAKLLDFYDSTTAPEEVQKIEDFLTYWGVCWYIGTGQRTAFIHETTEGLPPGQHWEGRLVWFPPGTAAYMTRLGGRDDNDSGYTFGMALVRPAQAVAIDGDINEDGRFDAGDLQLMQRIVLGETVDRNLEPGHADYYPPGSPDGKLNLADFLLMLQAYF